MVEAEVMTSDRLKGIERRCLECGRAMPSTGRMEYNAGVSNRFVEFECPVDDEFSIPAPDLDQAVRAVLQEHEQAKQERK